MWDRCLRDPEHRIEVGLHRAVKLFGRDVTDAGLGRLLAGVDDEDVEAAEAGDRVGDEGRAELLVRDVARQGERRSSLGSDQGKHLFGIRLLARQIDQGDVRTFTGERDGGGTADAGVAAGDESLAARQATMPDIARLAVIGRRIHLRGEPRCSLRLLGKRRLRILLARVLHAQAVRRLIGHGCLPSHEIDNDDGPAGFRTVDLVSHSGLIAPDLLQHTWVGADRRGSRTAGLDLTNDAIRGPLGSLQRSCTAMLPTGTSGRRS